MSRRLCPNVKMRRTNELAEQHAFRGLNLLIGLFGFTPGQQRILKHSLVRCSTGSVEWHLASTQDADAWFINGARAQLLGDGSIRIPPGSAGGPSTRFTLEAVDRPVAFAQPIACAELEPACRFSLSSDASIRSVLRELENRWLSKSAVQLWLAERLVSREDLSGRIYHVALNGRLLAVVDRLGDVGLLPGVLLEELELADWMPRPSAARFVPPHFHCSSFSEVIWQFAVRPERELLPARYRQMRIHFRRPPRVPQRLLRDEHLKVIHALAAESLTFDALRLRCCLEDEILSRALAALYLTGAITTDVSRSHTHSLSSPGADSTPMPASQRRYVKGHSAPHDHTVPAHLSL